MRLMSLWSAGFLGVLICILGIPLAARRISPNGVYGYRTAKTISDSGIWYRANTFCGVAMICAGMLSVAGTLLMFTYLRRHELSQGMVMTAAVCLEIIPVVLATLVSALYVRGL